MANFEIKDKVYKQIKSYCDLNKLDIIEYINSLVQNLVTANVYGEVPGFVKLQQDKQEKREDKKRQKEIESLKKIIEEKDILIEELRNQKTIESDKGETLDVVISTPLQFTQPIEEDSEKEVQPIYDFTKVISTKTTYVEEPPKKEVKKPKKRILS